MAVPTSRNFLKKLVLGKQIIEMMGCPGGCVNGGQPIVDAKTKMEIDIKAERAKVLYQEDKEKFEYRKFHENPSVKRLYEEYLIEPNSHKSHKLLHTSYLRREKFNI